MRTLLKKLSFAWLILAIVTAPLQVLALPVAMQAPAGCDMHADDQSDVHAAHHAAMETADDQATAHCPACTDHGCDGGGCTGLTCFSAHFQLSIYTTPSSLSSSKADCTLRSTPVHVLSSIAIAPLDRPPSV